MKWDLKTLPYDKVFDTYPELFTIYQEVVLMQTSPPNHDPLHAAQLMKFVVFSYDLNSPIIREASIHKRRAEALQLVGFSITTEEELQRHRDLVPFIIGTNTFVNRLCIHYCKLQNNFDWLELCSLQDILDDVDITLKEETGGTEKLSAQQVLKLKLEIRDKSTKIRDEMRVISNRLFMNDDNMLNYAAGHSILEKRLPIITPERWVSSQRNKTA